jgi:hypothetical protein
MELAMDKTHIINVSTDKAPFLDVYFNVPKTQKSKIGHKKPNSVKMHKLKINQV